MAPEQHLSLYRALDRAATAAQASWRQAFVRSLVILGAVAVLSVLDGLGHELVPPDALRLLKLFAIVVAVLGVGYEIGYQVHHRSEFTHWTVLRVRAEELRSEAWFYLFDMHPNHADAAYPEAQWQAYQAGLAAGLTFAPDPAEAPADDLLAVKHAFRRHPLPQQAEAYIASRVRAQLDYFQQKERQLDRRLRQHRRLIVGLLGLAGAWSLCRAINIYHHLGAIFDDLNLFVALIAIVGLLKSYIQVESVERLFARYRDMQTQLLPHAEATGPLAAADLKPYVQQVERVFRTQVREWEMQRGE